MQKLDQRLLRMQREKGFTLIEVMVSIAVFAIGIVSVVSLLVALQTAQLNAQYLAIATHAARVQIERIRVQGSDSVVSGASFAVPSELPSGTGTVTVSSYASVPGTNMVDVRVNYKSGGQDKKVIISSLIPVHEEDDDV